MSVAHETELQSEEKYFALDEASQTKHEFWNGRVVAMTDVSLHHVRVSSRICFALSSRVLDQKWEVVSSRQKIKSSDAIFTFPDVVVSWEDEQFDPRRPHVLLNPHILVEILSPSTRNTDRGAKLAAYQALPSLLDTLIV